MALYLGSNKREINLNGIVYRILLPSDNTGTGIIRLLSSEGYILKDSQGLYLTAKEDK